MSSLQPAALWARTQHFPWRQLVTLKVLLGTALVCLFLSVLLAGFFTWQAVEYLKSGQLPEAVTASRRALPIPAVLTTLTGYQIATLELWHEALITLDLAGQTAQTLAAVPLVLSAPAPPDGSSTGNAPISGSLLQLLSQLEKTSTLLERSSVGRWLTTPDERTQLLALARDFNQLGTFATQETITLIVLFQNSDELRATGGFMGSYGVLTLAHGQPTSFVVKDIYDADGQFQGFIEPPTGVREYLSSGNGLRLPDANWHPDFGQSAQQILGFFAVGRERAVDGVVVVNLSLAESLIRLTGPLTIADYDTTVTAENLSQVARADRAAFFPGSSQKKHFLSLLATQLQLKLSELPSERKKELVTLGVRALEHKDIQLFFLDPAIQELVRNRHWGGSASTQLCRAQPGPLGFSQRSPTCTPADFYFFLVESNVGINKVNRFITRNVALDLSEYRSQLTLNFQNTHGELGYVNYQRLLIKPEIEVRKLTIGDTAQTTWDEELITSSTGETFKQVGFLVTVLPNAHQIARLELTHTAPTDQPPSILIQKQAGLPPTPYALTFNQFSHQLLLENDWRDRLE